MLKIKQNELLYIASTLTQAMCSFNNSQEGMFVINKFYNFLADAILENKTIITIGVEKERS